MSKLRGNTFKVMQSRIYRGKNKPKVKIIKKVYFLNSKEMKDCFSTFPKADSNALVCMIRERKKGGRGSV